MCLDLFLISRDRLHQFSCFLAQCLCNHLHALKRHRVTLIFREQNQATWPMELWPLHLSNTRLRALCLQRQYGNIYKALCSKIEGLTTCLCWIPQKLFFFLTSPLIWFFLVQADLNSKYLLGLCFFCLSLLVFILSFGQLSFCPWPISDSAFALFY